MQAREATHCTGPEAKALRGISRARQSELKSHALRHPPSKEPHDLSGSATPCAAPRPALTIAEVRHGAVAKVRQEVEACEAAVSARHCWRGVAVCRGSWVRERGLLAFDAGLLSGLWALAGRPAALRVLPTAPQRLWLVGSWAAAGVAAGGDERPRWSSLPAWEWTVAEGELSVCKGGCATHHRGHRRRRELGQLGGWCVSRGPARGRPIVLLLRARAAQGAAEPEGKGWGSARPAGKEGHSRSCPASIRAWATATGSGGQRKGPFRGAAPPLLYHRRRLGCVVARRGGQRGPGPQPRLRLRPVYMRRGGRGGVGGGGA